MKWGVLAAWFAAASWAAPDDDPVEVLMRLRDQVLQHAARIPNHTCVETVRRDHYDPAGGRSSRSCDTLLALRKNPNFSGLLRLATTDRLRLDVALAGDREIYSWAGASRFEQADIDEWTPEGAIGTGAFAAMLIGAFDRNDSRYSFDGDTTINGRAVLAYSFTVPRDRSRYRVRTHGPKKNWVITGYSGRLLVDPRTAELVRLTIRTDELPSETGTCETDTRLEYGMIQLTGGDYLLPRVALQRFIGRDGSESENRMTFESCRDFAAESTLTLGEKRLPAAGAATAPAPLDLPAGLEVSVEFVSTLDGAHAAAGDRIAGRLAGPVRDRQTVLVESGAAVVGRLMRVQSTYGRSPRLTIALRWDAIEVDGAMRPLSLVPNRRTGGSNITVDCDLCGTAKLAFRRRAMEFELPRPGEGRYGVYHFPGEQANVRSGFRTEWLTAGP